MLQMMASDSFTIDAAFADADPAALLLRRIAGRDRQALDQLYGLFQESVYRFALARLNDQAAASDVLNETMLEVWQAADRFRGDSKARTWILGIAFHKTMDLMRTRYRHETEELDPAMPDTDATDMALVLQRMEDIGRVQDALACLSQTQRSVLHLAFYEDLPYAEIARVLECPEGTVKTRVFHAKQVLKRLLDRP